MLRDRIAYGLEHRAAALDVRDAFGRGLDREKADRFVGMYVNDLTLDYGDRGREAVRRLSGKKRARWGCAHGAGRIRGVDLPSGLIG